MLPDASHNTTDDKINTKIWFYKIIVKFARQVGLGVEEVEN